jgi:hypothetical protein
MLVVSGFIGMQFARRCIPPVPDGWHARIYVALLGVVLIAIAV